MKCFVKHGQHLRNNIDTFSSLHSLCLQVIIDSQPPQLTVRGLPAVSMFTGRSTLNFKLNNNLLYYFIAPLFEEVGKNSFGVGFAKGNRIFNIKIIIIIIAPIFFKNGLETKSGFEMCFDIGSRYLGCWGQNTSPYAQGCDLS